MTQPTNQKTPKSFVTVIARTPLEATAQALNLAFTVIQKDIETQLEFLNGKKSFHTSQNGKRIRHAKKPVLFPLPKCVIDYTSKEYEIHHTPTREYFTLKTA